MAINQTKYIDITSGVGGRNLVERRELMGLIFSSDIRFKDMRNVDDVEGIHEFSDSDEVLTAVGGDSLAPEYQFAVKYFGFISKSITRASHLKIAYWRKPGAHGVATKHVVTSKVSPYNAEMFAGEHEFTLKLEGVQYTFKVDFGERPTYSGIISKMNRELQYLYVDDEGKVVRTDTDMEDCYGYRMSYDADEGGFKMESVTALGNKNGVDVHFREGFQYFGIGAFGEDEEEKADSPLEAIVRVDEKDDNFGSFAFIDRIEDEEVIEVAKWTHEKNYKYLFSFSATHDVLLGGNCLAQKLYNTGTCTGTCLTESPKSQSWSLSSFIPMVLFASTKYTRANASKNFMFQSFDNEEETVTTLDSASIHDTWNVNYIGCTQQAGKIIKFYQDGYNVDGVDTGVFCNEVWFKDAVTAELMNLFLTQEKIPANSVGKAMCESAILGVIGEAKSNGTIYLNKELTNIQKMYIDTTAGTPGAYDSVSSNGYWLSVDFFSDKNNVKSSHFIANYVLIYAKGDSIRKVEGSNILI